MEGWTQRLGGRCLDRLPFSECGQLGELETFGDLCAEIACMTNKDRARLQTEE